MCHHFHSFIFLFPFTFSHSFFHLTSPNLYPFEIYKLTTTSLIQISKTPPTPHYSCAYQLRLMSLSRLWLARLQQVVSLRWPEKVKSQRSDRSLNLMHIHPTSFLIGDGTMVSVVCLNLLFISYWIEGTCIRFGSRASCFPSLSDRISFLDLCELLFIIKKVTHTV